jgi:hypothetical protein
MFVVRLVETAQVERLAARRYFLLSLDYVQIAASRTGAERRTWRNGVAILDSSIVSTRTSFAGAAS